MPGGAYPDPLLVLNIHAGPCPNRCRHCWTNGSPAQTRGSLAEAYGSETNNELFSARDLVVGTWARVFLAETNTDGDIR